MRLDVSFPDLVKVGAYIILWTAAYRLIAGHLVKSDNETAEAIGTALAGVTP